jgi:branched-chain amino acid transport system substrate-binding protein
MNWLSKFLENLIDQTIDRFRRGQWSSILVEIDVILFVLFFPEKGFLYQSISSICPKDIYPILLGGVLIIILLLAFVIRFFRLDRLISSRLLAGLLTLLTLATIVVAMIVFFQVPQNITLYVEGDKLSWGEEFLTPVDQKCKPLKDAATLAYNKQPPDYGSAKMNYSKYVKECKDASEAQIYLNNATAMLSTNPMKIAVAVPISRPDGICDSQEILRGIAIAQDEWNIKDRFKKLLVGIVDDGYSSSSTGCGATIKSDNNETGSCGVDHNQGECKIAYDSAKKLVDEKDILGVIGHFSSDATESAAKIYNHKLVAISPTSTAIRKNSEKENEKDAIILNSNIFRTAPDNSIAVENLTNKIPVKVKKIAIVYEGEGRYSRLFKENFTKYFSGKQGKGAIINSEVEDLLNPCNFSISRGFDAKKCLKDATGQGANALLLIPTTKNANKIAEILKANSESSSQLDLLGSDSMYKEQFIKGDNQNRVEGMLMAVPWNRKDDPCEVNSNRLECKAARLIDAQNKPFSPLKISWRTATAYDTTQILLEGLMQTADQKCRFNIFDYNSCLRTNLREILLKVEAKNGVLGDGKVKFDPQGDRMNREKKIGVVVKVQGGKFIQQ